MLGLGRGQEDRSGLQAKSLDLVLQEVEGSVHGPAQEDLTSRKICVHLGRRVRHKVGLAGGMLAGEVPGGQQKLVKAPFVQGKFEMVVSGVLENSEN